MLFLTIRSVSQSVGVGGISMVELSDDGSGTDLDRRSVLKGIGGATIGASGLVGLTGTASAHRIIDAVFCGCSQVCACGNGELLVWVAEESENGFNCERKQIEFGDDDFDRCYEVDEKKIIAIQDGHYDDKWVSDIRINPNNCASRALDDCDDIDKTETEGASGGPCGDAFLRTCRDDNDDHPGQGNGPPDDTPGNGGKGKKKGGPKKGKGSPGR